ncbi:MAG: hypothetical protein ACRCZI_08355 [Cetobacterium sp.]
MNNQPDIPAAIWAAYQLDLAQLIPVANELQEEIKQGMIALTVAITDGNLDFPYAETRAIIDERHHSLKNMIAEINLAIMVKAYASTKGSRPSILPADHQWDPHIILDLYDASMRIESIAITCSQLRNRVLQQIRNDFE